MIDRGVAYEHRAGWRCARVLDEVLQSRRIRFARPLAVATHDLVEECSQAETVEHGFGGARRFIGEHGKTRVRLRRSQRLHDTGIRLRVVKQTPVVDLEKPREALEQCGALSMGAETGGAKGAGDQQARTLTDHVTDGFFGDWRSTELGDELVGGIGKIAARVDERAVQVERDQAPVYVAHDVGVSQTVTRTTGMPCSREMSKISRAMRSTVGLLSSV